MGKERCDCTCGEIRIGLGREEARVFIRVEADN